MVHQKVPDIPLESNVFTGKVSAYCSRDRCWWLFAYLCDLFLERKFFKASSMIADVEWEAQLKIAARVSSFAPLVSKVSMKKSNKIDRWTNKTNWFLFWLGSDSTTKWIIVETRFVVYRLLKLFKRIAPSSFNRAIPVYNRTDKACWLCAAFYSPNHCSFQHHLSEYGRYHINVTTAGFNRSDCFWYEEPNNHSAYTRESTFRCMCKALPRLTLQHYTCFWEFCYLWFSCTMWDRGSSKSTEVLFQRNIALRLYRYVFGNLHRLKSMRSVEHSPSFLRDIFSAQHWIQDGVSSAANISTQICKLSHFCGYKIKPVVFWNSYCASEAGDRSLVSKSDFVTITSP